MIVGEPLRDFREKAGGEECSERDEQAVQLLAGFAGGGDRPRTPVNRLEGLSLRVAAGHGCA